MAGEIVPVLDMSKDVGQRASPELAAEIAALAPAAVGDGDITTPKLDSKAVTQSKIDDGAVGTVQIEAKGVKTANLDDESVGTGQLADNGVTAAKVGVGVVTVVDFSGTPIANRLMHLTVTEFASILSPDPDTTYMIKPG